MRASEPRTRRRKTQKTENYLHLHIGQQLVGFSCSTHFTLQRKENRNNYSSRQGKALQRQYHSPKARCTSSCTDHARRAHLYHTLVMLQVMEFRRSSSSGDFHSSSDGLTSTILPVHSPKWSSKSFRTPTVRWPPRLRTSCPWIQPVRRQWSY